ncbi:ATP-binding protein [Aquimarina sp. RZ0]|uniref:tetratricopeptide repeat-containing sensor histidine kinase n=1 Tax=Aquimarina sp. RZ0 TaxID=2607730 RepID=UPI0011F33209|nr:ATP-binding protein [Aquimarina sp. RZ0]KAA1244006.1 sensor histidine kinase [Aquimarina sp. RZ0]
MQKLYLRFFILISFVVFYVQGQDANDNCDEWEQQADNITDVAKAMELNKFYMAKVSEKCKIRIFFDQGNLYLSKLKIDSALYHIDRGITLAKNLEAEEELAFGYTEKINIILAQNKFEEAQSLIKQSRTILESYPNSFAWVHYYDKKGYMSFYESDYYAALDYMDSTIIAAKRSKHIKTIYTTYENKGVLYKNLGDYEKSAENYLLSIKYQEEYNTTKNIGITYRYLSNSFFKLKQYEKAKQYVQKAIALGLQNNNEFILMTCYTNLASYNRYLKNIEEADMAIDKAVALSLKTKSDKITAAIFLEKGRLYLYNHKKYDEAETFLLKAYEAAKKAKLQNLLYDVLVELIELSIIKNNPKDLKNHITSLTEITKNTQDPHNKAYLQKVYSKYNEIINRPYEALKHLKAYYTLQDSIVNTEVSGKVAALEKKYDTQKKELKIANLNKEKQEQKLITQKAEAKQNLYLLIAMLLFFLLVVGVLAFRKLRKQQKELTMTNQVKNRLFSIIAHDLRGMIIPFQRSGKILKHHIDRENYEKTIEISKALEKNSEGLSNMLDNLLNWSLDQMKGYVVNPEKIFVGKELNEISEGFDQQATYKNTKIRIKYKEDIPIKFDKGAFHVIFRNLIGNALKYTENGTIRIEFKKDFNTLLCSVIDTGVGMSEDQLRDIFTLKEGKTTAGTYGEKGTGLGLNLIYRFVKMNKGVINVSSKKRIGTRFDLSFPISESFTKDQTDDSESLSA